MIYTSIFLLVFSHSETRSYIQSVELRIKVAPHITITPFSQELVRYLCKISNMILLQCVRYKIIEYIFLLRLCKSTFEG
jgi:hypothetical protein